MMNKLFQFLFIFLWLLSYIKSSISRDVQEALLKVEKEDDQRHLLEMVFLEESLAQNGLNLTILTYW
jgi:hypothetical protein